MPRRAVSRTIVARTFREHATGMLAWIVGGGAFNLFETYALHMEMADYPGGGKALSAAVTSAAEAMRPLRWPVERLDTLGGYLTFHNILFLQGFLAIYAVVQGVHAVRRPEEQGSLDPVLAAGGTRRDYLRDRVLGFALVVGAITIGLALSVAGSLAFVGEPETMSSLISLTSVGLCTFASYAFGLAIGQLRLTARSAMGIANLAIVTIYILTNEAGNLGPLDVVRWISPFEYANRSRALVPGVGWDARAMLALLAMAAIGITLAVLGFDRRDLGATPSRALLPRRERRGTMRVQRPTQRSIWVAQLVRHRIALATWTLSGVGLSALWTGLEPIVADAWQSSDFMKVFLGGTSASDVAALYTSFGCDILAPIVVAYAAANAGTWVADLQQGRVEAVLSTPLSWTRLFSERIASGVVGVAVIAIAWVGTMVIGGAWISAPLDTAGLLRTVVMAMLVGWAASALAAVLVAWTRRAYATTLLIVYVVVAYTLSWFVQVLRWPDWVNRLSVFNAFGHPYDAWPDALNLGILVATGVGATIVTAAIAERTAKIAT